MRNVFLAVLLPLGFLFWNGCSTIASSEYSADYAEMPSSEAGLPRKIVRTATLAVNVGNLSNAVAQAESLVKNRNGFIETQTSTEESANMTMRIPADVFETTVSDLGRIGSIRRQNINSKDVTEYYIDQKERLKNMQLLRDKLQALLEKSTNVQDTLAIETELNRVQSDLDAMEAKMLQLAGHIQFSVIHLTFAREKILGPLGYLFKGIFWGIEKLFVIR